MSVIEPCVGCSSVTVGLVSDVRMMRINYEEELCWELYHPINYNLEEVFDIIKEVGPSSHLLGTAHTLKSNIFIFPS